MQMEIALTLFFPARRHALIAMQLIVKSAAYVFSLLRRSMSPRARDTHSGVLVGHSGHCPADRCDAENSATYTAWLFLAPFLVVFVGDDDISMAVCRSWKRRFGSS